MLGCAAWMTAAVRGRESSAGLGVQCVGLALPPADAASASPEIGQLDLLPDVSCCNMAVAISLPRPLSPPCPPS